MSARLTARLTALLRPLAALAGAALSIILVPSLSSAATWVPLDSSVPGQPATITCDTTQTSPTQTVIDIHVHGYWRTDRVGGDGRTYQQIEIPGLASIDTPGAPDLPVARFYIAWGTTASEATIDLARTTGVHTFAGQLVWPQPVEERELATGGSTPEQFQLDTALYAAPGPYPTDTAVRMFTSVQYPYKLMQSEAHPAQWDPQTGELTVAEHTYLTFRHLGVFKAADPLPQHRIDLIKAAIVNWPAVKDVFTANTTSYDGDFLFVVQGGTPPQLEPLIAQKKGRGFHVSVLNFPSIPSCATVRNAIQSWYDGTPSEHEHYAILIGDHAFIPTCPAPDGDLTDDLYGDVDGDGFDDILPEVYVGRLAANSYDELGRMVTRILDYEDHPECTATRYDKTLLIAHTQGAPGKYEGNAEEVRTRNYADVTPHFTTHYGSDPTHTNTTLTSAIESGFGLIAYRGHGTDTAWWTWNTAGVDYSNIEVDDLVNAPAVVWSIACGNLYLPTGDCFGEHWLSRQATRGAVSFYGAGGSGNTTINHELYRRMFSTLFDEGYTVQGQLIARAELLTGLKYGATNPFMYYLLGDPEMRIRRSNPSCLPSGSPWITNKPAYVFCCAGKVSLSDLSVATPSGAPVPGVMVSLWKPGAAPDTTTSSAGGWTLTHGGDEVLVNGYTGPDGSVRLEADSLSEGMLYLTFSDDEGNVVLDSILVTAAPTAVASPGRGGDALRLVARAGGRVDLAWGIAAGTSARVEVADATGRILRQLPVTAGALSATWDGRDDAGRQAARGVYLIRVRDAEANRVGRTLLMR